MRMHVAGGTAAIAVAACVVGAPCARAGTFSLALEGGYYDMTNARKSAEAVFGGSAGGALFGLSGRMDVGRSFFVGAGGRWFQRTGERAFAADRNSPAFRLGHPLKVRVLPIYALLGYRFSPDSSFSPYVGLGPGFTSYREESTVAGETTTESSSKVSGHLVAGVEFGRGTIRAGVEGMYTLAPDVIGTGGISQVYDENDVGGLSVVGRIVFIP
jgi:hypothetical protein